MQLTGHKTEAVYRRYAIVVEADLREGVAKLGANDDRTTTIGELTAFSRRTDARSPASLSRLRCGASA
jgi:hypothetical protein